MPEVKQYDWSKLTPQKPINKHRINNLVQKNKRIKERIERKKQRRKNRKLDNKLNPKIRNYKLYVLLLKDNKYYVGMTSQTVGNRYTQHIEGYGSKWTKLHEPIDVIEIIALGVCTESKACIAEDELTIEYMNKYGISNVRGGSLCSIDDAVCKSRYNKYSTINTTKLISA